jgi:pimeloyl-ACP methyl ester carboxylesterase
VAVLAGAGHLHHLVDPDAVADAVVAMAGQLGIRE